MLRVVLNVEDLPEEGTGVVLELVDGGVDVPGGGGGGDGVASGTHEPSPLQVSPVAHTCMCHSITRHQDCHLQEVTTDPLCS